MSILNKTLSRRELLKLGGLAGLAGALGASRLARAETAAQPAQSVLPQVPRRVLGKTQQTIPILLMGGSSRFDQKFDPRFAEACRFGVNYFDMADCYAGGTSETALGGFLERSGKRKDIWITTKSCDHSPAGLVRILDRSLERMKTDHVDLFFLHALKDSIHLSPEMARLSEQLKKDGKIRFFGFSCHGPTSVELLNKAAGLPWIDAIMFKYNFREYGNKELNAAMDACHKANIGLIAMKTQGSAVSFEDRIKPFEGGKFTRHQAVLKAVWADERITAAVSEMDTLEKLKQNIAAAIDPEKLSDAERAALQQYAQATEHLYCRGCDHICGSALPEGIQVGAALRCLMYHDAYGNPQKARETFASLPAEARQFAGLDFSKAATLCPHQVDIGKHMQRAMTVLV
ncbi:MAG: aldo/keto reductase [Lentisphaerae bacterium]|nr:aldo/keto reductase [Lentisphaerota bacterium]